MKSYSRVSLDRNFVTPITTETHSINLVTFRDSIDHFRSSQTIVQTHTTVQSHPFSPYTLSLALKIAPLCVTEPTLQCAIYSLKKTQ